MDNALMAMFNAAAALSSADLLDRFRRKQATTKALGKSNGPTRTERRRQLRKWEAAIAAMMKNAEVGIVKAMRMLHIPASTYYKYRKEFRHQSK